MSDNDASLTTSLTTFAASPAASRASPNASPASLGTVAHDIGSSIPGIPKRSNAETHHTAPIGNNQLTVKERVMTDLTIKERTDAQKIDVFQQEGGIHAFLSLVN